MASGVRNIPTKNYQNLIIGFQVTVKNVGNVFFETQCRTILSWFCLMWVIGAVIIQVRSVSWPDGIKLTLTRVSVCIAIVRLHVCAS